MKVLEHMKAFSTQYLTIATFVGIIWGAFVIYDNWRDNNSMLTKDVKTIIDSQIDQKKTDSLLLVGQQELRQDFENHIKIADENAQQLKALQKSYIRYIGNDDALTKKDFLEYMQGLTIDEKKKLVMSQISE